VCSGNEELFKEFEQENKIRGHMEDKDVDARIILR
jgi:hypothetical protein